MVYDRHSELQSKWDKAFGDRGYYVEIIGNIIDEAVSNYRERGKAMLTMGEILKSSFDKIICQGNNACPINQSQSYS